LEIFTDNYGSFGLADSFLLKNLFEFFVVICCDLIFLKRMCFEYFFKYRFVGVCLKQTFPRELVEKVTC